MTASKKSFKRNPNILGKKLNVWHDPIGDAIAVLEKVAAATLWPVRYQRLQAFVIGTDEERVEDVEFFTHFSVGSAKAPYSHFAKFNPEGLSMSVYPSVEAAAETMKTISHPEGKKLVIIRL